MLKQLDAFCRLFAIKIYRVKPFIGKNMYICLPYQQAMRQKSFRYRKNMSINNAIFPKFIENVQKSTVKKIVRYETIIGFAISAFIIFTGYWLVLFLGGIEMLPAYPMSIILSFTILVWLVVGSYISFIFVPANKYYFVTRNQLVALLSFLLFCIPGLFIYHHIWTIIIALTLSGFSEILYCRYLIHKHKML